MYLFLLEEVEEEIGSGFWWFWDDEVKERLEETGNCLIITLEEPPKDMAPTLMGSGFR
jgi:hypothetical protein